MRFQAFKKQFKNNIQISVTHNTTMENIEKLEELVAQAKSHASKLYTKNTKAAATKLRNTCQDIKKLCQDIRVNSLEYRQGLPTKRRADGEPEAEAEGDDE